MPFCIKGHEPPSKTPDLSYSQEHRNVFFACTPRSCATSQRCVATSGRYYSKSCNDNAGRTSLHPKFRCRRERSPLRLPPSTKLRSLGCHTYRRKPWLPIHTRLHPMFGRQRLWSCRSRMLVRSPPTQHNFP